MRDARNHFGKGEADRERGQNEHEPRQRPSDADIEQYTLGVDRRAHADERAERSQPRRRQKVRQAGIHAMNQGREVMAELMRQKDCHQRQRKRQPAEEHRWMVPEQHVKIWTMFQVERNVVRKVVLHGRAHRRGGKERNQEQQRVQPVALACARKGKQPPAGSGLDMLHVHSALKRKGRGGNIPGCHDEAACSGLLQRL